MGGASSVTEIATCVPSGATATWMAPAPAFSALPTRSFSTNRARSRSLADSVSTLMSMSALAPTARANVSTGASRFCTLVELSRPSWASVSVSRSRLLAETASSYRDGATSRISRARCSMQPEIGGKRAVRLADHQFAPRVRLLLNEIGQRLHDQVSVRYAGAHDRERHQRDSQCGKPAVGSPVGGQRDQADRQRGDRPRQSPEDLVPGWRVRLVRD